MFFSPSRAVLSAILRDEYLTSAVRTIALKTARDGEKNMTVTLKSKRAHTSCFPEFCGE